MGDLTKYFSRAELRCPCCGRLVLDFALLDGLQALRELARRPVRITSGYRCPNHNREVGGRPESYHTRGAAADVVIAGLSAARSKAVVVRVPAFASGGIGVYSGAGFVHLDVRERTARWSG